MYEKRVGIIVPGSLRARQKGRASTFPKTILQLPPELRYFCSDLRLLLPFVRPPIRYAGSSLLTSARPSTQSRDSAPRPSSALTLNLPSFARSTSRSFLAFPLLLRRRSGVLLLLESRVEARFRRRPRVLVRLELSLEIANNVVLLALLELKVHDRRSKPATLLFVRVEHIARPRRRAGFFGAPGCRDQPSLRC